VRARVLVLSGWLLVGCPQPVAEYDAGPMVPVDAGRPPVPCNAPEACREGGLTSSVCRGGLCNADVLCGSDFECGLGERCTRGRCTFTGCTKDSQCETGKCQVSTYSCVECSTSADCPGDKPLCDTRSNTCQACQTDAQCRAPGPARCGPAGACVHCLTDADCFNGLTCGTGNVCVGARKGDPCPPGVACAAGLSCIQLNGNNTCLPSCTLYQPACDMGEVCFKLTYANSPSLVFEGVGPIGVCFRAPAGARGLRDTCQRTAMGTSNCQPNLQCVPESASTALCRSFCNPLASGGCVAPERCVSFPGDTNGRRYGLCLPDNGYGSACARDGQCRANTSCQPSEDPGATSSLSNICQFNVGAAAGLAPCGARVLTDGGVVPADLSCRSGACRADPQVPGAPGYFCYAACEQDADCSIAGRTGVCDGTFAFTTPFGTSGTVRGCRPTCESNDGCAGYDAGVACRVRLVSSPTTPSLTATCSPSAGQKGPGAPCLAGAECRSGLCQLDDSRGTRRQGTCLERCAGASSCALAADGGVFSSLSCQPVSLLASSGFDGVPNTPDDRLLQQTFCAGGSCLTSADCRGDAGLTAVCAPMVEASGPSVASLRCQAPTTGALVGGQGCFVDAQCQSGVCGTLQSPSTGTGRACFEACTASSSCPAGTTCRVAGLRVTTTRGPVNVDSCAL